MCRRNGQPELGCLIRLRNLSFNRERDPRRGRLHRDSFCSGHDESLIEQSVYGRENVARKVAYRDALPPVLTDTNRYRRRMVVVMAKQNTSVKTFTQCRNNTNPHWWRDPGLRLNVFHCIVLYFCVFYLGYDASLLNGLQAMPQWQKYFNNPDSSLLGLISASLFLRTIAAIVGAGPFGKMSAIALLQEIAHPRLRSILASSFYCNYYFGSIAAAWFCFGSLNWGDTNWSWRAPCLF
ncbi:hypothetical protein B7463_g1558, partial [Scytalidium lignicola]